MDGMVPSCTMASPSMDDAAVEWFTFKKCGTAGGDEVLIKAGKRVTI
jgi:hypothetical protein